MSLVLDTELAIRGWSLNIEYIVAILVINSPDICARIVRIYDLRRRRHRRIARRLGAHDVHLWRFWVVPGIVVGVGGEQALGRVGVAAVRVDLVHGRIPCSPGILDPEDLKPDGHDGLEGDGDGGGRIQVERYDDVDHAHGGDPRRGQALDSKAQRGRQRYANGDGDVLERLEVRVVGLAVLVHLEGDVEAVDADARGEAEHIADVQRHGADGEHLGVFLGEHHVEARHEAEGSQRSGAVLFKFARAGHKRAEIQLHAGLSRTGKDAPVEIAGHAGGLLLLGHADRVLVPLHGLVVALGLRVLPGEFLRSGLGNQRAAPGHGDIADGVVKHLRQILLKGQVHAELAADDGDVEIKAKAAAQDRGHGVDGLLAGIDGLVHLGADGRQLGIDPFPGLPDGEIGGILRDQAGGQAALEISGVNIPGVGVRIPDGILCRLHLHPPGRQIVIIVSLVMQRRVHRALAFGVDDFQHEADLGVVHRGNLGLLVIVEYVEIIEGAGIGIGLDAAFRVGLYGFALRHRAGQRRQVIDQGRALGHQRPGDVKAAVAGGAGVHIDDQLHAVIVVVDELRGVEHDVAGLFGRNALDHRIGVVVVLHRRPDAGQGHAIDAVELQGELVLVDDRDVNVPGVGVAQHAAARPQSRQAGVIAHDANLVGGHVDGLRFVHRGQQRVQPLGKFRLCFTVDDALADLHLPPLLPVEVQHLAAQVGQGVGGLADALGQAQLLGLVQAARPVGQRLGSVLDQRGVIAQAIPQEVGTLLDDLGVEHELAQHVLVAREFTRGEFCVGRRVVGLHPLQQAVGAAEHADHVVELLGQLVVQPVDEGLGVPGVLRLHAVVIDGLPGRQPER